MKGIGDMPHTHISPLTVVVTFLIVAATFGTLHLLCAAHPDNRLAQAWVGLGF